MKTQVLQSVISQNYFISQIDMGGKYSVTVSAVESWKKPPKELKDMLLKDLSPRKIKTIVSNFYLKSY